MRVGREDYHIIADPVSFSDIGVFFFFGSPYPTPPPLKPLNLQRQPGMVKNIILGSAFIFSFKEISTLKIGSYGSGIRRSIAIGGTDIRG